MLAARRGARISRRLAEGRLRVNDFTCAAMPFSQYWRINPERMDSSFADDLTAGHGPRSMQRFLQPLLAKPGVQADFLGSFEVGGKHYSLPRFTLRG